VDHVASIRLVKRRDNRHVKHAVFGQHHLRQREDHVTHVQVGRGGTGLGGILTPGGRQQRAVHGVDAHGRLVVVGIINADRLQRSHRVWCVVMIAIHISVGAGRGVTVVVHVNCGRGRRADPYRAAILSGQWDVTVTRRPADRQRRRQQFLRDQGVAPIPASAGAVAIVPNRGAVVGANGHKDRAVVGIKTRPRTGRHYVTVGSPGGHAEAGGARAGLGINGNGARLVRIIDEHVAVAVAHRADRGHITGAQHCQWRDVEPAVFILLLAVDIAGDQVDLDGQVAGDAGVAVERYPAGCAAEEVGASGAERGGIVGVPISIRVDADRCAVIGGHDEQPGVLKHRAGGDILTHRQAEVGAVAAGVIHLQRPGQYGAGVRIPHGAGDRHHLGRRQFVARVEVGAGAARVGGHVVA